MSGIISWSGNGMKSPFLEPGSVATIPMWQQCWAIDGWVAFSTYSCRQNWYFMKKLLQKNIKLRTFKAWMSMTSYPHKSSRCPWLVEIRWCFYVLFAFAFGRPDTAIVNGNGKWPVMTVLIVNCKPPDTAIATIMTLMLTQFSPNAQSILNWCSFNSQLMLMHLSLIFYL